MQCRWPVQCATLTAEFCLRILIRDRRRGRYTSVSDTDQALSDEEQTYIAAMKSDLRNLVTAEEAFFADSVKYTAKIGAEGLNYSPSAGNSIARITLTEDGWLASIANGHTRVKCVIFIGSTSTPPARKEGVPACAAT